MLTVALQHCGADPSFAIGSELNESGSNAHLGTGEEIVAEADESDGAFLALPAYAGIVTNVEPDHLDYWGTFAAIEAAFLQFAEGLRDRGGFLVVCVDDPGARRLAVAAEAAGVDVRGYGVASDADYRVDVLAQGEMGLRYDVVHRGVRLGATELRVPGIHNALNSTAAFVAGIGLGFASADLRRGLEAFSGTRRRFDFRGSADGVRVYDDYAHHPTEIAAVLRAARGVVGQARLVVAFQAHHYYRTALFAREFGDALGLADEVVVLEVFAPGEEPIPGASGQTMASYVPLPPEQVRFEPSWSRVPGELVERTRPGDVIMTLGAGDIGMLAPEILDLLRARERDDRPERSSIATTLGVASTCRAGRVVAWSLVVAGNVVSASRVRCSGRLVKTDRCTATDIDIQLARASTSAASRARRGHPAVRSVEVRRGWPVLVLVPSGRRSPSASGRRSPTSTTPARGSGRCRWRRGMPCRRPRRCLDRGCARGRRRAAQGAARHRHDRHGEHRRRRRAHPRRPGDRALGERRAVRPEGHRPGRSAAREGGVLRRERPRPAHLEGLRGPVPLTLSRFPDSRESLPRKRSAAS
jgi:UDP-N-acetylmuramate--alanine ligase